ncbi:uncharacterized protein LOC133885038 isoform X2 [Phragmites australis]|uniref:uncharacterized protein LOC133885038 isoform X2 n=1 Tax=Phragmites australis TaxID=29695 RepID=UPI002D774088|nr:uncharacterized protein LOC133885038 isoform X2 [Phragmites australis]
MPGSIQISATQPPATTPLFLQVAVGKREYSGNVEQDDLSFPVTSLRESMVIMLYNADRELISKAELKTKEIVESGTMDVVFTLDSGGKVILQLQFLLNDDDRKRIQEMRNSAMKRKQQELLGDGYELNFPDSPLSKQLIEKISNIQNKGDQPKLRKSMSLDDLQERAVYSGISVDPRMKASRDLLLQSGGRNTSRFEDPNGSKKGHGKPESRSSSSVKKMISSFEGTSSQGNLSSETGASSLTASGLTEAGKAIVPFDDKGSNYRSGKHVLLHHKKQNAPGQTGVANAYESRSRRSSSRGGASKQNMRENDLSRSKRRSSQAKHRRSIGPYSLAQLHSMGPSRTRSYLECPLNYLVASSSTWIHPHVCVTTASRQLKDLLELEHLKSLEHVDKSPSVGEDIGESTSDDGSTASAQSGGGFLVLNGWLINQGVRAAIVIIACGVMFLNNR